MLGKRTLGILFVALTLCGQAWAGPTDDADMDYRNGNYKEALRAYLPLAERGNTDAQNSAGVMYRDGNAVPQDYVQAVKWFRRSADHGNVAAMNNLGTMYFEGKGVPLDYVAAVSWFRRGADLGNPSAQ